MVGGRRFSTPSLPDNAKSVGQPADCVPQTDRPQQDPDAHQAKLRAGEPDERLAYPCGWPLVQGDIIARQALQVVPYRLRLSRDFCHHRHRAYLLHTPRPICLLDEIEPKISQWFNACTMDYVYTTVGRRYDEIKNPPVSKEQFLALKDSIVMSAAVRNMNLFTDISQIGEILNKFYHSEAYTQLFSDAKAWERVLDKKYKSYEYLMMMAPRLDYVMPGKVIDGGGGEVDGQVVSYRFSGERLIPHPYQVTITSRVTNIWAYIVTFLIIALAIGSFFYRKTNHR